LKNLLPATSLSKTAPGEGSRPVVRLANAEKHFTSESLRVCPIRTNLIMMIVNYSFGND
jgi:hypothetical protein